MSRHSLTWVVIFGVVAVMFLRLPQMAATQDAITHIYGPLIEVDALAKQKYVEQIDTDRLVEGAIRGLLRELDPYSGYISPTQLPTFERRNQGKYIGIGIEIGFRNGRLVVIAPIEGSPAAEAGIASEDMILAIDGHDTKGLSVFDVEELLIGSPDTPVRLRVQREIDQEPLVFSITRGPVNLKTVRGFSRQPNGTWNYWIDPDRKIAYIRVANFLDSTMNDFERALVQLGTSEPAGLILDLRFNPGGIMQQAINLVDRFVERGLILSTVSRRSAVREYFATRTHTMSHVRLAVLINSGSASSSEIVSGALQDHGRATIVGERSFGKGSVQHLIYLKGSGGAVKITTAHYQLPSGRILHRTPQNAFSDSWGVLPDKPVKLSRREESELLKSWHLLDHARTEPSSPSDDGSAGRVRELATRSGPAALDLQLQTALSVLRANAQEE